MSKLADLELLKTKSFDDLCLIFKRCKAAGGKEADEIIKLIEANNLLIPQGGGLPQDHPIIVQMREILRRPEIRTALKAASDSGLAALSAVDEVFKQEIGSYYGQFDTASWAGALVAEEMKEMGYKEKSKKSLPKGSVVKRGAVFN